GAQLAHHPTDGRVGRPAVQSQDPRRSWLQGTTQLAKIRPRRLRRAGPVLYAQAAAADEAAQRLHCRMDTEILTLRAGLRALAHPIPAPPAQCPIVVTCPVCSHALYPDCPAGPPLHGYCDRILR